MFAKPNKKKKNIDGFSFVARMFDVAFLMAVEYH